MFDKVTEKPYYLLGKPHPVDDVELNRILGMAVANVNDPFGANADSRPGRDVRPRDAIANLYPRKEAICTDVKIIKAGISSSEVKGTFDKALGLWHQAAKSRSSVLETPYFRRIDMENGRKSINDLLKPPSGNVVGRGDVWLAFVGLAVSLVVGNLLRGLDSFFPQSTRPSQLLLVVIGLLPAAYQLIYRLRQLDIRAEYRKQVLELLEQQRHKKDKRLGIINSVIICTDLGVNKSRSGGRETGASLGTGELGLSHGIDVNTKWSHQSLYTKEISGAYEGDYLIACSYLPLYLKDNRTSSSKRLLSPLRLHKRPEVEFSTGDEEMWYIGEQELKGSMKRTLGAGGSSDTDASEETKLRDLFGVTLLTVEEDAGDKGGNGQLGRTRG